MKLSPTQEQIIRDANNRHISDHHGQIIIDKGIRGINKDLPICCVAGAKIRSARALSAKGFGRVICVPLYEDIDIYFFMGCIDPEIALCEAGIKQEQTNLAAAQEKTASGNFTLGKFDYDFGERSAEHQIKKYNEKLGRLATLRIYLDTKTTNKVF